LIGLSPLPTAHPSGFQPTTVRPSTGLYPSFSLAMGRSLRFRVCPQELIRPLQTRFRFGSGAEPLSLAPEDNSPDHNAKGTQSPRRRPKSPPGLPPLVGTRFQVLFHSPPGVLFTFPSRYSFTIGRGLFFSLGGWSPLIQPGRLVPRPTRVPQPLPHGALRLQGSHLLRQTVPGRFGSHSVGERAPAPLGSLNPGRLAPTGLGSSPFARRYSGNLT
jgi:hypothetical protein